MIDTGKFGKAVANSMDRLDALVERGDITNEYMLDEVIVIAALSRPSPERDSIEFDKVESMIFVDGTSQIPWIQVGILTMALGVVAIKVEEDGDA